MIEALSRQPGEVRYPDDGDIGDSGSGQLAMQNLVFYAANENHLKVVVPHLEPAGFIQAMKTDLSSSYPMVALAHKRCSTWNKGSMPTGAILYIYVLAVATSGILHHKSKVIL